MAFEMNIVKYLHYNAKEFGDCIAYVYNEIEYSWKEIDILSNKAAIILEKNGIQKLKHVGIYGMNSIEWIVFYYGLLKVGAVPVLINYEYKTKELERILDAFDIKILLKGELKSDVGENSVFDLRKIIDIIQCFSWMKREKYEENNIEYEKYIFPDDTACIIFTSGTTSIPKGVVLWHRSILGNGCAMADQIGWTRKDCLLLAMPMYHCSGLTAGILMAMCHQTKTVIMNYFTPALVLKNLQKYRCTAFSAVPSMLLILEQLSEFENADFSFLESGTVAGSTFSEVDYNRIVKKLKMFRLQPCYGQTETAPIVTMATLEDSLEKKSKTVGKALPGVKIRIWGLEEDRELESGGIGEIQVQTPYVMKGYYRNKIAESKKWTKDGWLKTEDIGYIDSDQYLYFIGRIKDIIIRGGENITPFEVEQTILDFGDCIEEVKVVGVPDRILGENVAAIIKVKNKDYDILKPLKIYLNNHLTRFKIPRYYIFVEKFPMTGTGKIDLAQLKTFAKDYVSNQKD